MREAWGFGPWTFEQWASLATIYSLPVAAVAAFLALLVYSNARRTAADGHMHSLFREYLIQQAEFLTHDRTNWSEAQAGRVDQELRSLRYYVLEEMFNWLQGQWPKSAFGRGWLTLTNPDRLDFLLAWKKTIVFHLKTDADKAGDELLRNHTCYSTMFLVFVSQVLRRKDLMDCALFRTGEWEDLVEKRSPKRSVSPKYVVSVPHEDLGTARVHSQGGPEGQRDPPRDDRRP